MIKHWAPQELKALRRLRERFLNGTAGIEDYWREPADLALYDSTFAQRIGWKWDAVLGELRLRGWRPRGSGVLDWGCGSGIAHRRVLAEWPHLTSLAVYDRSPMARRFAEEKARTAFPGITIAPGLAAATPETLLLVSHVLNELPPKESDQLLEMACKAGEVIWVEAGTYADSRRLIEVRERLRGEFSAIAPCTHQARCGLLAAENAPHWCHHFATPPSEIFQDARWAEFGRVLGIDLRDVPYSFLVLARTSTMASGWSRIIGRPREAKGYTRVLSCQAEGATEFVLQKRDAPGLFRVAHKGQLAPVYRWRLAGGKIVDGAELCVASTEPLP